ncbi:flagellar hook-basal body complex protein FliE [Legionella taurinensis]|uniref:Flagellar hook-basal body complex protein FliE n=1 Tax=Legionella taurinensis TaxID=70611 RepID=A0A3A5L7T0_9GAMM|nr:flagellar hook-basal body complex protein FliE [Legionella taurinensis]MDX1836608.1 flagellar hook-basal body complex protein FliE [Legionella taurinensis]PUT42933.1 flagellar hook-basal body complex protein FliE [Legionella taurinensis]PUT45488.1 flagellar hook-basal body complex protein FliE [Legionella taurinensis]PUT46937.1 flagellar hook-basal body complex protein FliE [Legionella taurinensis]PUT49255.1 flagellar hook-basal body complex protein FliE [Legionella taurinensis]
MSDINTVSLLNQLKVMASEAQGKSVEFANDQVQFNDIFQKTLGEVNALQQTSDGLKARFELGDPNVSIGEVMIAGQKANLGFEAALRVRNRFVQAYQDIMNMPI